MVQLQFAGAKGSDVIGLKEELQRMVEPRKQKRNIKHINVDMTALEPQPQNSRAQQRALPPRE